MHTKPWFYQHGNNNSPLPAGYYGGANNNNYYNNELKPVETKKQLDQADIFKFMNSEGKVRTRTSS